MANQKEKEKKAREETIELDEYTAAGNISDRKQSTEISVVENDHIQLGITEHVIFAQTINKRVMEPLVPHITETASKLFKLKDVATSDYDMQSILRAQEVLSKLMTFMKFIIDSQLAVMHSLSKFSYCSQRVFLYLIYQNFCGQEDESDDENEGEGKGEKEADGQGIGDGKGGRENITD